MNCLTDELKPARKDTTRWNNEVCTMRRTGGRYRTFWLDQQISSWALNGCIAQVLQGLAWPMKNDRLVAR